MKQSKAGNFFVLVSLFIIMTNNLLAGGLGIYLPTWSFAGTGTIYYDLDSEGTLDYNHIGAGIFIDNRLASQRVFNYRPAFIYERVNYDNGRSSENYFSRFAFDQLFGFGILRKQNIRLWLGPQVRLAYMNWNDDDPEYENWRFGFGIAPMFGSNFNLGSVMTLCLDIGLRSNFYFGKYNYSYTYGNYSYEEGESYYLTYYEIFINFGVAFRFGGHN